MRRITPAFAIVCLAWGCGSSGSGGPMGMGMGMGGPGGHGSVPSAAGMAASTPSVNGGSTLGPSVNGGVASGPSAGGGGSTSMPSAGKGGAVTVPALGSSTGRPRLASCADVAAYAHSLGTPSRCAACLETSCCDALLGCYNSSDCLNYAMCAADSCQGGLSGSCSCDSQFPAGMGVYDHYAQCAIGVCESACVTVTVSGGNPGGPPGGGSCGASGTQCAQNGDCCSGTCTTVSTSGGTVMFCQ